MQRIVGSFLAVGLLFAGVALAVGQFAAPRERITAPRVGEVAATTLANGAPVFVVRHGADEVSVLSAVSSHLEIVVAWCEAANVFVQPLGATVFDRHGGWRGGPAPTGLAAYEAVLDADGRTVAIGARGALAPRPGDGQHAASPGVQDSGLCDEGSRGGVFPPGTDPDDAIPASELAEQPVGRFVAVRGLLDMAADPARLCDPPADGSHRCPPGAAAVTGFHWDPQRSQPAMSTFADWMQGAFLVRVGVGGSAMDVALLARADSADPGYTAGSASSASSTP